MNNLTLSGEDWTYYETIGGGQGACRDADGPSAEHVAMSNTLNTPIEALRDGLSGAGQGALGAAREWRRGPPPRRRRDRAGAGGDRADALHPDRRAPPARPSRQGGRCAGQPRARPAERRADPGEDRGRAHGRATGCESRPPGAVGTAPNQIISGPSRHRHFASATRLTEFASIGRSTRIETAWEWAIRYLQLSL